MERSTDVIIVGGGIVGCAIAYFLQKQQVGVVVLERGEIGGQASGADAGLLAPIRPLSGKDPFKLLQLEGIARLAALIPELESASGMRVDYAQTGTLRLLPPEKIAPTLDWVEEWRRAGFHIELLAPEQIYAREPLLLPGLQGAVTIAEEAQVSPIQLVRAYAKAADNLGAQFVVGTEVVAIESNEVGNRVVGVRTSRGELFPCSRLVLALGAWSAGVGAWLGVPFPVRPVRGELIAVRQTTPPIRHIIFDEGLIDEDIYLAPKPNDTIIVGASKADVGFDTSVSVGGVLHMLDIATRLIPSLASSSIDRIWAGLRPKTSNSRPILGPVPGWENVTVASGHGGFGVTLSAITGETIANVVMSGQAPEIIRPFIL